MNDAVESTANPSPRKRSGRFRVLENRPIHLDGLAVENASLGLIALRSPFDPEPSLVIHDGVVIEMDHKSVDEFDSIDAFIAARGLDLNQAVHTMATANLELARVILNPAIPRDEVAAVMAGATPAKLAQVVALLRPHELIYALARMRVRRTPSNQAHVTNRLDDPLLLAADAATAVAYGFRELETTVPVLDDAASNALALLIGSQVGRAGALTQCSVEEAIELELGIRGLTTYAETISLYGTETVFSDGDDTPWSKAFLVSAYASRGIKVRVTSGAGSEVLLGEAEQCSMLYLESRCVSLARAMGVQGVQNGGIDGASVAGSVPNGMRGLIAENLMVMLRNLESCSGNDTLVSESDIRRTARTMPVFFAGSDFIFSGFGSIPRYDNMFGPSNFNADDLDDYLVIQRDWGIDGGLRSVDESDVLSVRERATRAVAAVYQHLGLASFDEEHITEVIYASGSKDLSPRDERLALVASAALRDQAITALDVVRALNETGYETEARRVLAMVEARRQGDYLQPAAIFDEAMNVLSAVTDPNDDRGPGTGYQPSPERQREISSSPLAHTVEQLLEHQASYADCLEVTGEVPAELSTDPRDVVIGVSPAFARSLWMATSGLTIAEIVRELLAGLNDEGCQGRLVRINRSIDLGVIGLSAAQLSGSGISIGLQAKGTVLIHQRDLNPLANLELLSVAPLLDLPTYRHIGRNAARHARKVATVPARNPYTDEAITARYHARTVAMVAIERGELRDVPPTQLRLGEWS